MNDKIDATDPSTAFAASRRPLGINWYGQTAASICWMTSVFVYGIDGAGDLLQLLAASAWLIANISNAVAARKDRHAP